MFRPNESLLGLLVLGVFTASCETSYTPLAGSGGASFDTGGFTTQSGGNAGASAFPTGSGGAPPGGGAVPNDTAGTTGGGAAPPGGGAGPIGGAGFVSNSGGTMGVAGSGEMTMSGGGGGAPPPGSGGAPPGAGGAPPMPSCPATSLAPGTTNGTIQFGGTTRSYVLHVPASYPGKTPVPLVTDWHPILFTDTFEQSISGYQAKSDQEGFIVVWPQGIDNAWNVGPCCTTSRTVDDVGFARAVITKIESQACIDTKRVYAVGYSMGGGMSLDLACNAADIIAAISPAAFDLMADSNNWPCHPTRPISVIDFRSTTDPIVPYAGGATNPPNGLPVVVTFLGAQATFQKFSQLDQCTGSPAADPVGTGCQTYSQCAQGVQVTLCTKQGGGHDPGDPAVAWNVLKKYTLP
jgi:polyhydroxybutyrate depolymerase